MKTRNFLSLVLKSQRGSIGAEDLETFDDLGQGGSNDGYEEGDWDSLEMGTEGEEESEGSEEEETLEEDGGSQVDLLEPNTEESVDPEDKDSDSKETEEGEEGSDKGDESDKKEESGVTIPETTGKAVKATLNGEKVEVPEDLEFIVPVEGKREKVTLAELRNNYSGKVAWDRKFTELGSSKKELERERDLFVSERQEIVNIISNAKGQLVQALTEKGDPRKALNNLIDLMGIDAYDFNIALMGHLSEEVLSLNDMTEVERQAYWVSKENEYLKAKHESLKSLTRSEQESLAARQAVDSMREAHGVSEEAFTQAVNELTSLGVEGITADMAIERAQYAPIVSTVCDLLDPYEDELTSVEYESLALDLSQFLKRNPATPIEEVQEHLAEKFKVEPLVKTIEEKIKKTSQVVKKVKAQEKKEENRFESFDDFI